MALRHDGVHTAPPDPMVFISYARDPDREFVDRLNVALRNVDFKPWVDERSIPYGEEWRQEIHANIKQAVAMVFLVSPEAKDSEYCKWELDLALGFGKKIIPLLRRPELKPCIPASINPYHRLEVRDDSELDSKLPKLRSDLGINWGWERRHAELLNQALKYNAAPKDHRHEYLLLSYQLDEAEEWYQSATLGDAKRIVPEIEHFLTKSREHVARSNGSFQTYTQALSDEFGYGIRHRNWDDITQEISELPRVERTQIFSVVVGDAIRAGHGRFGNHFFYLLGDLPRALKLQKSDWAVAINSMLDDRLPGWFVFSAIASGDFTLPAFFAACDVAANAGEPTAPVSLPRRIASDALIGPLGNDYKRENAWLFEKLHKHARSKAVSVAATIPASPEEERAQIFALEDHGDIFADPGRFFVDPGLLNDDEQDMDSAFVLFNDVLHLLHDYGGIFGEFRSTDRLHLLGRLAVTLARNRHWGTAYRACQCLYQTPLFEVPLAETFNWKRSYRDRAYELNVRDPKRQRYARRKCLEVLGIMMREKAPILWPAALSSRIDAKSKILHLHERMRSEDGHQLSEYFDAHAEDLLEMALTGEIPPFWCVYNW